MENAIQCKVDGMTCGNCALTISTYLSKNGASQINANASTGDVSFVVEEKVDVNALYEGINKLGFKVLRSRRTLAFLREGLALYFHIVLDSFDGPYVCFMALIASAPYSINIGFARLCDWCLLFWQKCFPVAEKWNPQYGCLGIYRSQRCIFL
jgi:copper chaperone CopZ